MMNGYSLAKVQYYHIKLLIDIVAYQAALNFV